MAPNPKQSTPTRVDFDQARAMRLRDLQGKKPAGAKWSKRNIQAIGVHGQIPDLRAWLGMPAADVSNASSIHHIIVDRFAAWEAAMDVSGTKPTLTFRCTPTVRGRVLTMFDMLVLPLEQIDPPPHMASRLPANRRAIATDQTLARIAATARSYPALDTPIGHDLLLMLMQEQVIYTMTSSSIAALVRWFLAVCAGDLAHVFAGVCPKYSTTDGVYDFKAIGIGIGLISQRILDVLPFWYAFIKRHQLNIRIVVAIGDMEAAPDAACARFGITREEFVRRIQLSHDAFRAAALAATPGIEAILDTPLLTQMIPGMSTALIPTRFAAWGDWIAETEHRMCEQDLPPTMDMSLYQVLKIVYTRTPFYRAWFVGDGDPTGFCPLDRFITQAVEYGTVGRLGQTLPHVLTVRAGAHVMAPMYNLGGDQEYAAVTLNREEY